MRTPNSITRRVGRETATRYISILIMLAVFAALRARAQVSSSIIYTGALDGSAAVPIDSKLFAAVSDEDSIIRIYRRDAGGQPQQRIDLSAVLELDPRWPESDIEAAARVGDRVYWITSHGRNKTGKERESRHRFFATDIRTNENGVQLVIVGKPYKDLLEDLLAAPQSNSQGPCVAGSASESGRSRPRCARALWRQSQKGELCQRQERQKVLILRLQRDAFGMGRPSNRQLGTYEIQVPKLIQELLRDTRFGETDEMAHAGRYDQYLTAAHNMDELVRRLWFMTQAISQYRGKTTFIIIADHGRGNGLQGWRDHGEKVEVAENDWIAIIGPDTPALGERANTSPVTVSQIPATIAALQGEDCHAAFPKTGSPITDVLPGTPGLESAARKRSGRPARSHLQLQNRSIQNRISYWSNRIICV